MRTCKSCNEEFNPSRARMASYGRKARNICPDCQDEKNERRDSVRDARRAKQFAQAQALRDDDSEIIEGIAG